MVIIALWVKKERQIAIKTYVFEAYRMLFDVTAPAPNVAREPGQHDFTAYCPKLTKFGAPKFVVFMAACNYGHR